jgi:hypothetical protein
MAAAVLGATLAMSAYAGESTMKKGEPSSVDESRPDMTGKEPKGKAGVPTSPSKGPSSVDESKTGQAGKGPVKGASKDDSKMASPKTPSSVDESKTGQTGKDPAPKKSSKKDMDKDMAK